MNRFFSFIICTAICMCVYGQSELILTLDDTLLSAEQIKAKNSNPTKLVYPLKMKDKIPQIQCNAPSPKRFSVSADLKVEFSPGNLQHNAASGSHKCADGSTQSGTWRFAEHQWDRIGDDNENISSTYNGWIDLFGWGTSGWSGGVTSYLPYSTSSSTSDYCIAGDCNISMTDEYTYCDWGIYNAIGSASAGTWRTPTKNEWVYLLQKRENASSLVGQATVNEIEGLIILPDDWAAPEEITFTAGSSLDYTTNQYTIEEWNKMEAAGAVFLPAAGLRHGSTVSYKTSGGFFSEYGKEAPWHGLYWSSTASGYEYSYHVWFYNSTLKTSQAKGIERSIGMSVRLVR